MRPERARPVWSSPRLLTPRKEEGAMSIRRVVICFSLILMAVVLIGIPFRSQLSSQSNTTTPTVLAGRNVNMVSGTKLPLGDPWLQRQNEPSVAVSSRNPMHLFAAANDYRTIDISDDFNLRGIPGLSAVRDSWIGVFESFDYGESWITTLLPGFPQDTSYEAQASPIHGFDTACDPIVRAGANGLFYFSGIAFNRSQQAGAVFVARYVDLNNREKVEVGTDPASGYRKYVGPIEYMNTKLVDGGNPGQFIDMPNMAVDVPRNGAPFGNVYLAYTVFLGNTSQLVRSRIVFVRSSDGGVTWSGPIKLTESQHIIQRPVIAIDPSDPTGKTIYVAFRRFAFGTAPGGIVFVKSIDGGLSFSKPVDVATLLYPFDQGTSPLSFRTNSYPTMAVDGNGVAYIAWAQRYGQNALPSADGQARIVISYLPKGSLIWAAPQIVDSSSLIDGHQFMPTMTFGGGRLMLAWYDQRGDISLQKQTNKKFIEDGSDYRHTIDVRAAEGTPGTPPVFLPSIPVSRYLFYMDLGPDGEPVRGGDGKIKLWQGQYDYINFPLFELGTKPFHGDYIEIVSSPQILPPPAMTSSNSWKFNTSPLEPTTSPVVWADNRDVRPPASGVWTIYNPPTSIQDGDFYPQAPCSSSDTTGMKNQNVYTANLNHGVIVGSPGNTKQLDIPRTFVVVVKNTMEPTGALGQGRHFHLTLSAASGVPASFDQFASDKTSLDITVEPSSSVSCTVYAGPSTGGLFDPVKVNVYEGENGPLVGYVILNPDSTNNLVLDPSGSNLTDEFHTPNISNPKVWKYDVGNPKEPNSSFLSPRGQNSQVANSGYVNPRGQNEGIINPRGQNSGSMNPRGQNESVVNNEMLNPRGQNASAMNTSLTDMTWSVSNDGNTTSAYTFNILSTVAQYFSGDNPPLIGQVLVYKIHTNPIDSECKLLETHADELVVNVSNPRGQNPSVPDSTLQTMSLAEDDFGAQDITFNLAPGEQAEVTLRVYDPDINDPIVFDTKTVAGETTAEAAKTGATTPPEPVIQPNVPWVNPLPAIAASPMSMSFPGAGNNTLNLSLLYPPSGPPLAYSASTDSNWLSVSPTGGSLSGTPTVLTVTVDDTGLTNGSYTGFIVVTVPEASNNPLRIPVFIDKGGNFAPSMDIVSEITIPDGGTFDFGTSAPGSTSDVTFNIENFSGGGGNLILSGKPIITIMGANADQFSVQQQPTSPVASGNSTSFTIRFQPTSGGLKTATFSIANNTLYKNPYDVTLQGKAVGLAAYYPFSGNANDESGNGKNGTVSGATLTTDRFGNANSAYSFNGQNAIITTTPGHFASDNKVTVSLWVNVPGPSNLTEYFVYHNSDFGVWQDGNQMGLAISHPSTNSAGGTITYGVWHHFAGTFDGSIIRTYIDGILTGVTDWPGPLSDYGEELTFGYFNNAYWQGELDDIRIYGRALSASEIQALYSLESGQVAYYPFNGNANDESGNQLNGTPVETLLTTDRFGNANRAYSFDGVNDAISVPGNSLLDITNQVSLAAWVYPTATKSQDIVLRSPRTNNPPNPYGLALSQTGDIVFELSLNGSRAEARRIGYDLNKWSLIVGTYDGTLMRLYVNGSLVATHSVSGTIDIAPQDNYYNLLIGTRTQQLANTFQGILDDIRIHNRVLSGSEIQALYDVIK